MSIRDEFKRRLEAKPGSNHQMEEENKKTEELYRQCEEKLDELKSDIEAHSFRANPGKFDTSTHGQKKGSITIMYIAEQRIAATIHVHGGVATITSSIVRQKREGLSNVSDTMLALAEILNEFLHRKRQIPSGSRPTHDSLRHGRNDWEH